MMKPKRKTLLSSVVETSNDRTSASVSEGAQNNNLSGFLDYFGTSGRPLPTADTLSPGLSERVHTVSQRHAGHANICICWQTNTTSKTADNHGSVHLHLLLKALAVHTSVRTQQLQNTKTSVVGNMPVCSVSAYLQNVCLGVVIEPC